jgi:hypothetical protein
MAFLIHKQIGRIHEAHFKSCRQGEQAMEPIDEEDGSMDQS